MYLLLCVSKRNFGKDRFDQIIQIIIKKVKLWLTQMTCHNDLMSKEGCKSIPSWIAELIVEMHSELIRWVLATCA